MHMRTHTHTNTEIFVTIFVTCANTWAVSNEDHPRRPVKLCCKQWDSRFGLLQGADGWFDAMIWGQGWHWRRIMAQDLVIHQADEWGDHQCSLALQQRWQLVAQ